MGDDLSELVRFLGSLEGGTRHQRGPVLVVRESASVADPHSLLDEVESAGKKASYIRYSGPSAERELLEEISNDVARGIWPLLELGSEPSSSLIELLKGLPERDAEPGRLLVLVERDFIESGMQFPYFYELFGWICSV